MAQLLLINSSPLTDTKIQRDPNKTPVGSSPQKLMSWSWNRDAKPLQVHKML